MGNPGVQEYVRNQLIGVRDYAASHPDRLLGACHFQFLDKAWIQNTSEGSFGAFAHTNRPDIIIQYGPKDFTHWDVNCDNDTMNIELLQTTQIYDAVKSVYKP